MLKERTVTANGDRSRCKKNEGYKKEDTLER